MHTAQRPALAHQEEFVVTRGEHLAGDLAGGVGRQVDGQRRVLLGGHALQLVDAGLLLRGCGRDRVGHPAPGERRDAIRTHVVALHVEGDGFAQGDDAQLGRGIIGLAEVADQPGSAGHVYEGAGLLGTEAFGGGPADEEAAVEMDIDHRQPVVGAHLVEDRIAQDASVVHHDIQTPETVHGAFDDTPRAVPVGDAVGVDQTFAASLADQAKGLFGRRGRPALAL
ncbi:Uncharacterised protein [Klebsiella pneumoniae]|nr:Uncharacterised protein [Klebsiella pneumoniae]